MTIPLTIKAGDLDVGRMAHLARLNLTTLEAVEFSKQLAQVLGHFERLKKVDVTNVEAAAHAFPHFNVWSEDLAGPGLSVEDALKNAPAQRDHMVVVPKVVE